jgi:hypothetical protein
MVEYKAIKFIGRGVDMKTINQAGRFFEILSTNMKGFIIYNKMLTSLSIYVKKK